MPGPVSDSSSGPPDGGSALDRKVHVVFAAEAGSHDLKFVEVETDDGKGVSLGEWEGHDEGKYSHLVFSARGVLKALGLSADPEVLSCAYCGFKYEGDQGVTREILTNHIEDCPEHPMGKRLRELTTAARAASQHFDAETLDDPQVRADLSHLDEVVEREGAKAQSPSSSAPLFDDAHPEGRTDGD